jgi:hypothetical protein
MTLAKLALAPIITLSLTAAPLRGLDAQVEVREPRAPLSVRAGPQGSTLLEVAQAYAAALGLELAASPEALERLSAARTGLVADLTAPPQEVHAAAQSLLLLGGFAVTGFEDKLALATWPVQGVEPLIIAEQDLARLAGHEALFVRTTAHIEGLDARTAATMLRGLFAGTASAVTPSALDEGALVVSGPAGGVHALLALVRGGVTAQAAPAVDWAALFPAPSAGLTCTPADTLMSVLERYCAATDLRVWVEPSLREDLAAQATGLPGPLTVAPDRVHAVVEALLAHRGVALSVLGSGRSALRVAQGTVEACAPRPVVLDLEREGLARVADHPATLFCATLRLPQTEVRTLATSMRALLGDGRTTMLMALTEHFMVVQARGATTALLGAIVLGVDGREAAGRGTAPASGAPIVLGGAAEDGAPLTRLLDEPALLAPAAAGAPWTLVHGFVPVGELDAPGRPADLLVSTLLEVEHLEVRTTATRMRAALAPGTDHVVACGDQTLLVGGRLRDVRARVTELRALDEQAAGR